MSVYNSKTVGLTLEQYFVSIICGNYVGSMETVWKSDTFHGDFIVKLIWRLSGNFICHVLSMRAPDNLRTNFTINSP